MKNICVFLLNEWLWSMTWGIYHAPFTMIWMFLLFFFFESKKFVASLLLSFAANAIAFGIFNGLLGLFLWLCPIDSYVPGQMVVYTAAHASLILAMIYSVIQIIFFMLLAKVYPVHRIHTCIVITLSNLMSAILIYKYAPQLFL